MVGAIMANAVPFEENACWLLSCPTAGSRLEINKIILVRARLTDR